MFLLLLILQILVLKHTKMANLKKYIDYQLKQRCSHCCQPISHRRMNGYKKQTRVLYALHYKISNRIQIAVGIGLSMFGQSTDFRN